MSRVEIEQYMIRLGIKDINVVTPQYVLNHKNILTDEDFLSLLILYKQNYYTKGYDKGCEDAY